MCNAGEEGLGNLKGVRKICEDYGGRIKSFCTFDSSLSSIVDRAVGSKRFRVKVRTRGGHSYNDFGNDNAIAGLASLVGKLYKIQVPEGGKTTYNVGMISGGTSVNTIAQEAEMLYEFRSDKRRTWNIWNGSSWRCLTVQRQRDGRVFPGYRGQALRRPGGPGTKAGP